MKKLPANNLQRLGCVNLRWKPAFSPQTELIREVEIRRDGE